MAVGGRNRRVAEAFAKNGGKRLMFATWCIKIGGMLRYLILIMLILICRSFDELEAEMLQGQKLQVDNKDSY